MLTGLNFKQQRLEDRDVGLFEKIEDIHFLGVKRIVEGRRDIGDFRHEDREQKNMRHVDLPGAPQHARAGDDDAALVHGAAIDESRGVAGDEDEDFGGVGKAVIADGEPVHDVFGDVVEKDQPQRHAAEQIEPQVALGRDRGKRLNHRQRLGKHGLGKHRLHNRFRPPQRGGAAQSTEHGRHLAI